MRILITGGAGFVGSSLCESYKQDDPRHQVVAFDNLKRRGSELNLERLRSLGVEFCHGDIRNPGDLAALEGTFDLFVEASAEASVLAGLDGAPDYLIQTNLVGTLNCLELARRRAERFVFLSTSRVYSLRPLQEISLREGATRFECAPAQQEAGIGPAGICERFPTHLPRSLYGATKLASELIIQEYVDTYGLRAVINRCGVIAGPGQFGKVEQGVFTLWVAHHLLGKPLRFTGFGGKGKQVRDLLHPADLFALLQKQVPRLEQVAGEIYNVGGGQAVSASLLEYTRLCREETGKTVPVEESPDTTAVDIPYYVSDYGKAGKAFDWQPSVQVRDIVAGIAGWIGKNESLLRRIFA